MFLLEPDHPIQKADFDSLDSRDRIIFGAMEIIAENGFEAASTRAIASRANLTIGMIWKLFGTKENLIREIDNHTSRTIEECFSNVEVKNLDDLADWVTNVAGEFARDHVLEFTYFRRAVSEGNPSHYSLLTAYSDQCKKHFRMLRERGLVRKELDLEPMASTSVALAVGILVCGPWLLDQQVSSTGPKVDLAPFRSFIGKLLRDGVGP